MTTLLDDLTLLYPADQAEQLFRRLSILCATNRRRADCANRRFAQTDITLLAYPDHLSNGGCPTLAALRSFFDRHLRGCFSHIHILPPFRSSGDAGFAPLDHLSIDPRFGDWDDIVSMTGCATVSIDLILNHVSRDHPWVAGFLGGESGFAGLFIEVARGTDFSRVARSRHHPPVTDFGTALSPKLLWTRYGPDQVDLNYRNPEVLYRMMEIAAAYISKGVRGLRLDAIAFAWKDPATSCSNLPHAKHLVRIIRDVVEQIDPSIFLMAETDVIRGDNSYVENGSELAHVAYRYESAPIVLHALLSGSCNLFQDWLEGISNNSCSRAAFNFLATHDGIYLRPADPPLDDEALELLAARTVAAGGQVITREVAGVSRPYELDITVPDLLDSGDGRTLDRLYAALALIVTLPGIPLIYLGTVLALRNDSGAVSQTGEPRAINRKKIELSEAEKLLFDGDHSLYFSKLRRLLEVRRRTDAFSPDAPCRALPVHRSVAAIERIGSDRWIRCYVPLGTDAVEIALPVGARDLLSQTALPRQQSLRPLEPLFVTGELER